MSAFWHPVSAVYLREPRALASPAVVRLLIAGEGGLDCIYAGDRMWPALRHGQAIRVGPLAARGPSDGELVLAQDGNVVEAVRVTRRGGTMRASCDADPAPSRVLDRGLMLGSVASAASGRRVPPSLARVWLDLHEAAAGAADAEDDPSGTVKTKYDEQAIHYARSDGDPLNPSLRATLARRLPGAAKVLVAGSGSGRETFALEALGYAASGVDFSARMVEEARHAAAARHLRASFSVADLREHEEPPGSLDAVFFTYDAYSLVPQAEARIALLSRIGRWLRPEGCLFLSARRARGLRDVAVLTLQRWRRRAPEGEWGDSHTRWLDGGGRLHRSFLRVFTARQLDREAARAGFHGVGWEAGHGLFERRPATRVTA